MSPTDREIRKRGALIAAAISLAWLTAGIIGSLWLDAIHSSFVLLPALVLIGAIAALPVSTGLGWRLAPRAVRSRKAFLPMIVWTILLTDVEIAAVASFAVAATTRQFQALLLAPLAVVFGLIIYGLPGLAIAIPSAWCWENVMRRTFSSPVPAGGGQGSADPLR
jgi:hypothetical protein